MAANIFDPSDYESVVQRIRALTPDHARKWGTMDIGQMLAHCSTQLPLGLGVLSQDSYEGPAIQRTRIGWWLILFVVPWTRGLPTPSRMNMVKNKTSTSGFEEEKEQLLSLLSKVQEHPDLLPHPFFGALDRKHWGRLIWKHLDHHLRQFRG